MRPFSPACPACFLQVRHIQRLLQGAWGSRGGLLGGGARGGVRSRWLEQLEVKSVDGFQVGVGGWRLSKSEGLGREVLCSGGECCFSQEQFSNGGPTVWLK
jgi:hypothetical protein